MENTNKKIFDYVEQKEFEHVNKILTPPKEISLERRNKEFRKNVNFLLKIFRFFF